MRIILCIIVTLCLNSCFGDVTNELKTGAEGIANATSVILPDGYIKDYSQGNNISQEQIEELKLGMSKFQIRQLLGTSTITDPFRKNRWDYIDNSTIEGKRVFSQLTLLFDEDNKLIEIIPRSEK